MAYSYVEKSNSWTPSGATARTLRGRLYYQITETDTTYKVDVYGSSYLSNENTTCRIYGTTTLTNCTSTTAYKSFTYSSGADPTEQWRNYGTTLSYTWTKGTTTQSASASYTTKATLSDGSGTYASSTGTYSFTIPVRTQVITYNANGGDGAIDNQKTLYNTTAHLSDGTGLTRHLYTLKGWNTAADGSGTHYDIDTDYTITTDLVLYAEWELNAIEIEAKVNGVWKTGTIRAKVNGVWAMPHIGYIKVNGAWKQITKE